MSGDWQRRASILLILPLTLLCACGLITGRPEIAVARTPVQTDTTDTATRHLIDAIPFQVEARFPHDRHAFTEGLLWYRGELIESTGERGQSEIRRYRISDGKIMASVKIPGSLFGEGIAVHDDTLYSVTWTSGRGFRWSLPKLKQTGDLTYSGQGWGMTSDGTHIVLSDGTPVIRFMDPKNFSVVRRLSVTANGKPLKNLNELEWVDGQLFANVWQTRWIVRIDPETGIVTGAIDTEALMQEAGGDLWNNTPNGMAWDPKTRTLYVTGKNWTTLFALKIDPQPK